jgi:hypothetical protein
VVSHTPPLRRPPCRQAGIPEGDSDDRDESFWRSGAPLAENPVVHTWTHFSVRLLSLASRKADPQNLGNQGNTIDARTPSRSMSGPGRLSRSSSCASRNTAPAAAGSTLRGRCRPGRPDRLNRPSCLRSPTTRGRLPGSGAARPRGRIPRAGRTSLDLSHASRAGLRCSAGADFQGRRCRAARLWGRVGGVPRAPGLLLPCRRGGCRWSAGWEGLQAGDGGGDLAGPGPALGEP